MQALTQLVLGPVWQTILIIALCYIVPFGDVFVVTIQVFVTLRQGMQKGLVATLGSTLLGITLAFILSSFFIEVNYSIFVHTLQWALTLSLPLWLFAGILRNTVSLSLTMQILTLVFMAMFVITFYGDIHLFPANLQKPIAENIEILTSKIIKTQQEANSEDLVITPENITIVNNFLINIFEVVTMYIMYVSTLLLARAWQSAMFQPGGFKQEFINLDTGRLMATLLVCLWLLMLMIPNATMVYALSGVIFVGVMWLLVTGVAFVHWLISTLQLAWGVVLLFYLLLILPFVSGVLILMLILTGLICGFVDLRTFVLKLKSSK